MIDGNAKYDAAQLLAGQGAGLGRRRVYQVTQLLEVTALPGGFIVLARDDHGERNRREIVTSPEALVAVVQRWAREANEAKPPEGERT